MTSKCPECGGTLAKGKSCQDSFHDLLALESQLPHGPDLLAHFYAVSSYNLQHPQSMRLTEEALEGLRSTVGEMLDGSITLEQARRRARRGAAIAGRVTRRGSDPVINWGITDWPVTVIDVIQGGVTGYGDSVQRWARSIRELLSARRA